MFSCPLRCRPPSLLLIDVHGEMRVLAPCVLQPRACSCGTYAGRRSASLVCILRKYDSCHRNSCQSKGSVKCQEFRSVKGGGVFGAFASGRIEGGGVFSPATWFTNYVSEPPPRQFRHAVPELFTDLYVFRVLGGTPVHLTWRGDLSRLKKTFFGHIA